MKKNQLLNPSSYKSVKLYIDSQKIVGTPVATYPEAAPIAYYDSHDVVVTKTSLIAKVRAALQADPEIDAEPLTE